VDTNGVGAFDGWGGNGVPTNEFVVVSNVYSFAHDYPLATSHVMVAKLSEQMATNEFIPQKGVKTFLHTIDQVVTNEVWGDYTNVFVDFVIEAARLVEAPNTDELPADAQVAMFFNTNGHLVLWHSYYAQPGFVPTERWTELMHPPVDSSEFVRVTIAMNYLEDAAWTPGGIYGQPYEDKFFTVHLNGGGAITSAWAYPRIPVDLPENGQTVSNMPPKNFLMHGSGNGGGNSWLSSFTCGGKGFLDDLQVVVAAPFEPPTQTVFGAWMELYGLSDPEGDEDSDGSLNWEEYIAGTIPDDDTSVMKVIMITSESDKTIYWFATDANDDSPFAVYRSTNLLDATGWVRVASNLVRSATGTNVWSDTTAPEDTPAFYLPTIPDVSIPE
jgi:hypothetical protein